MTEVSKLYHTYKHSEQAKQKIKEYRTGKKHSEETKKKLSESKKGNKNPFYGKTGINHPKYKGNNICYNKLHEWIRLHLTKPKLCEICNLVPPKDAANKSGKYLRDLNDWLYLCRKCHISYDKNRKIKSEIKSLF